MAEVIEMPRLSDTMTEGVIARWHKKVGDTVKPGELLAEIETDKATMEFEAPVAGVLLYIGAEEGKPIPIGQLIAIIGKKDEDISAILQGKSEAKAGVVAAASVSPSKSEEKASVSVVVAAGSEERLKASPLARAMAREKGIDLREVPGTGEGGRIVRRDIEAYLEKKAAPPVAMPAVSAAPTTSTYEERPITQMRKTIARRLTASMQEAPHFYLTISISMENAAVWREKLNSLSEVKISFNDFIIKACAHALKQHPYLNASWTGESIRLFRDIHIGFAVAVEEGLIVPVIRHADRKGLAEIAAESRQLAEKARQRKLSPEEYAGSTFSISNLGMFGIEEFTAVINPPESAILAVGAILPVVVAGEDGTVKIERRMKVTLSCDHRVVDGATGARFLQTFKQLLEAPERLLL
ncbi:MAG: pyruvate dehydrogenase complex dihydrolipoamide acetyltransferase [Bacteroidia bacterium]|nr:pyruvate dehydrogenase complex dihydrolipoamide acetyltransferase [Bacteroidia bacterium]